MGETNRAGIALKYLKAVEALSLVEETADTSYIELSPSTNGTPSHGLHIDFEGVTVQEVYKLRDGVNIPFDAQYSLIEGRDAINIHFRAKEPVTVGSRVEAIGRIRLTLEDALRDLPGEHRLQRSF